MPDRSALEKIVLFLIALALASAFLPACSGSAATATPTTLSGANKDAVLKYSEPMTDALLAGYNNQDYAAFSQDMNDKMKQTLNQDYFKTQIIGTVFGKVGKYESRTVESVLQSNQYVTIVYNAKFEKDDPVVVRISYAAAAPHQVSGLYFDSANLRKK